MGSVLGSKILLWECWNEIETDDENLLLISTHFKPISGFLKKYAKKLVNLSGSDAYLKVLYIHVTHQNHKLRRKMSFFENYHFCKFVRKYLLTFLEWKIVHNSKNWFKHEQFLVKKIDVYYSDDFQAQARENFCF